MKMKNLALLKIQKMELYNPPLAGRRDFRGLLLDFNERTTPPSPKVKQAIQNLLNADKLQLYPEYGKLEKKLARYAGMNTNQVMITNGSDQAIDLIFRTFTEKTNTVIIPTPSFAMFYQCAKIAGNKILRPLYAKSDLSFSLKRLLGMINKSVKLIVICNPNNPTGTLVPITDIEAIAKKAPNAIILADEAYFEFSKVTAIPLIKKYPNIIIVRTLSKAFGLSSLRIGYIIASEKYISELLKVRGPYAVSMFAYTAASAALDDRKNMQMYVDEVMNKAKPLVEEFFAKEKIIFYPSSGNFLLFEPDQKNIIKSLKDTGISVRPHKDMLRVSIGTVNQMKEFIRIYKKIMLKKYAFLDRDGTLIFEPQDTFQIDNIKKLKILDGVIAGLQKLIRSGYELIMVTNQNGIGTASFPKTSFQAPQDKMLAIFKQNNIKFTRIYVCPHLPEKNCGCRKPKTGLLKKFLRENLIDKNNSFMCGDRNTDKLFAENIGIKFIPMQTNGNFYQALTQGVKK